jgi:hypothetical protein
MYYYLQGKVSSIITIVTVPSQLLCDGDFPISARDLGRAALQHLLAGDKMPPVLRAPREVSGSGLQGC